MSRRPLGAIVSQIIVAGSSLLLQLVALRELGASGLGSFSLLLGILITVNSIQTGWIGDSLTVLDRFEPGLRRALFQSQIATVVLTFLITTALALPVGGVDRTTAVLFGFASVAWVVEETLRRILIARREFWKLVANDAAFAAGSFGLLGVVTTTGSGFTLETLVLAVLAGATVATIVGIMQLPRVELSRGIQAPSRLRELGSFAVWRAIQIGLRPGSQAIVRAVVAAAVSLEALGRLEAARLLIAPVLTIVNGAGVYLLPTYAAQVKRGVRFRPAVVPAMTIVAGLAAVYGVIAITFRSTLVDLLTDGATVVTIGSLGAWAVYSIGFGAGVPAGSAMVALGRSRRAFTIRMIDAAVGVTLATGLAVAGFVGAVPAGLGAGALLGAWLLWRALVTDGGEPLGDDGEPVDDDGRATDDGEPVVDDGGGSGDAMIDAPVLYEAQLVEAPATSTAWQWESTIEPTIEPTGPSTGIGSHAPFEAPASTERTAREPVRRIRRGPSRLQANLLWVVPLVLIVATEYKIRRRSIDDALSGAIDPMIAIELGIYALVGVWAVWRLVPTRPRLQPLTVLMWGYILTTAVSALYSAFPMLALARAVQLIIIGLVVHLVAVDGTLATITRLLHGWIVLLTASIVAGLAYVAPTTGPQEGRFTWLHVHSVTAGSMLTLSVPILFGMWLSSGRRNLPWPRWIYGSLLIVHTVFLLLTRTRGSIGGAAVAVGVIAWLWSGRRMKPELALGTLVAAGALALAFGGPVLEFLTRGETVDQIGTFNRRTEIWSLAWESFLHRPVFGLGFASAKGVFFDETGLGGAHNATINVMIDVGLVGLIWWIALIVGAVVLLAQLRRAERRSTVLLVGATGTARSDHLILLGIFTASLVNSITTEGLGAGVNVAAIWLFLCVAWLVILDRERRRAAAWETSASSASAGELPGEVRNRQFETLS